MTTHQDPAIPALPEPAVWALQLAAQAWCEPTTSAKVMDAELATVFAQHLTKLAAAFEADRAAGRASRVQGEPQWQEISTAPKTNARIIGAVDGVSRFICWGKTSHVPMYGWVLTDQGPEECDLCSPTHWMPLPAAPGTAPQAETLAVAEGFVLVPREPTSDMLDAATEEEVHVCEQGDPYYSDRPMSEGDAGKVWRAMLAAASTPTASIAPKGDDEIANWKAAYEEKLRDCLRLIEENEALRAAPKAEGEAVDLSDTATAIPTAEATERLKRLFAAEGAQAAVGALSEFAMREVLSELAAIDNAVKHWIEDKRPRSFLLYAITDNIRSLLTPRPEATAVAPVAGEVKS